MGGRERRLLGHHRRSLTPDHYLVPYIAVGRPGNRHLDNQIGLATLVSYRGQLVEPLLRQETRHLPDLPADEDARQINLITAAE